LSTVSADRKRLRTVTRTATPMALPEVLSLTNEGKRDGWQTAGSYLGKSRKDLDRLRTRLARAGFYHPGAPVACTLLEYLGPIAGAAVPFFTMPPGPLMLFVVAGAALFMYFAPTLVIDHRL